MLLCCFVCFVSVFFFLFSFFFFFKQKTAYEMRISDWSSDVCSSDLRLGIDDTVAVADRDACGRGGGLHILLGFEDDRLGLLILAKPEITRMAQRALARHLGIGDFGDELRLDPVRPDRKSTRLNSSH